MKKFLALIATAIFIPSILLAQPYTEEVIRQRLVGLHIQSEQARELAKLYASGTVSFDNNTYLQFRNAADSGNISVLKVDGSDDTWLNADTGNVIKFAIAGTAEMSLSSSALSPSAVGGNALGTTSVPWLNVLAGSAALDADITGIIGTPNLSTNGTTSSGYHFNLASYGNNAFGPTTTAFKTRHTTTAGDTVVQSGDVIYRVDGYGADGTDYAQAFAIVATVDGTPGSNDMPGAIDFKVSPDGSQTPASVLKLGNDKKATFGGELANSTTSFGCTISSAANTACTTTCTTGCFFGEDTGTNAVVACTDATADVCLCCN